MKQKAVSILLATMMTMGMLAGCGSSAVSENSGQETKETESEVAASVASEGEETSTADINEDGTVNNPEAVKVDENKLVFWSLFSGGDGEYMDDGDLCIQQRNQ